MIISIDTEKSFDKIQHSLLIKQNKTKTLQKAGIQGIFLNIVKAIYNKPRANEKKMKRLILNEKN